MNDIQIEFIVIFSLAILGCAMVNICTYLLLYTLVNYFAARKSNPAHTLSSSDKEKLSLYLIGLISSVGWTIMMMKAIIINL